MTSKLQIEMSPIYNEMLINIKQNAKDKGRELCVFASEKGLKYDLSKEKLMFIGRAVNQWDPPWIPNKIIGIEKIVQDSFTMHNPLKWVNEIWDKPNKDNYTTKRSAFWRVVHKILKEYQIENNDWASNIVWSNLYKIAPYNGGNPNKNLKDLQLEYCKKLIELEIEEYKPKNVVFLTGIDWAEDFTTHLKLKLNKETIPKGYECAYSSKNGINYAIIPHPQGKKEDVLVKFICEHLG